MKRNVRYFLAETTALLSALRVEAGEHLVAFLWLVHNYGKWVDKAMGDHIIQGRLATSCPH
jgi:hypothetical protein